MRNFRHIGLTSVLLAVVFGIGILFAVGCRESATPEGSKDSGFPDLSKIVAAKVGDTDVMLSDLVFEYQTYTLFNQQIIGAAVIKEEVRKRGIYPTAEEQNKLFEDSLIQQGGREQFLKQFPPDFPPQIALDALTEQALMGLLQQALLGNEYEAKHGAPTQEEINQSWEENKTVFQNTVVSENPGMKPEDVTIDLAMEQIKKQIKDKWVAHIVQTFFPDLIKSYQVTNYIADSYNATHPQEVEIPLVGSEQPSAGDTGDNPSGNTGGR